MDWCRPGLALGRARGTTQTIVPTAAGIELPEDEFEFAMRGAEINGCPGHYHPAVWYKPSKLCQIMTKFAEEAIKSPAIVSRVQSNATD